MPWENKMEAPFENRDARHAQRRADWTDVKFSLALTVVMTAVKLAELGSTGLEISRHTTDTVASVLCIVFIIVRARRQPEKLDDWGLTTRLTAPALLTGFVLFGIALVVLVAGGARLSGTLSFEPRYLPQMVEYIPAAFPQQFVMCSVGLATCATFRPFHGLWRLPLAVGLVFSLAHFWTPARLLGTIVPVQMLVTFPAGFFAAFYFLKYRNILPLTVIHAIMYPLLHNWIELHL